MSSFAIASIVFGCSLGAALIGMVLHVKLPDHHLDADSRDVVNLVMGLIATMSALVLSLLIASANSSYDRQSSELKALSANVLLLDRTLKFYGPGAKEARDGLRDAIVQTHDRIWSREGVRPENLDSRATQNSVNANTEQLLSLSPKTDAERMMSEPGRAGVREHRAITSADVRAAWRVNLMAVPDGSGLLDLRAISRLRFVRAFQYNRHRCVFGGRALGRGRDFPYS
jgi:hypothetical protein